MQRAVAPVPRRSDVFVSMLPTYEKLLKAKLKMLVFSGAAAGLHPSTACGSQPHGLHAQRSGLTCARGLLPQLASLVVERGDPLVAPH